MANRVANLTGRIYRAVSGIGNSRFRIQLNSQLQSVDLGSTFDNLETCFSGLVWSASSLDRTSQKKPGYLGPFLESPGNVLGPKSNFQIEIQRIRAQVLANKLQQFCFIN